MARRNSDTPDWYAAGQAHLWPPYTQVKTATPPWPVARTSGCYIELADGRRLLDGVGSWWTAVHGYNPPHIVEAVTRQLETMPHVMFGGLTHAPASRLAARLAAMLPGDLSRCFFVESGSVAVEVALKMAVQYWINQGRRGRTKVIGFEGGYHGDTLATMALCDPEEGMHRLFHGLLPQEIILPLPATPEKAELLDATLADQRDEIAAMIVEPLVQGAGGMKMHDPAVLHTLRDVADRHDVLLIFDEIFTGFGRTGAMFACEEAGVTPDIITLGKALTGGVMPLAAAVASEKIFDAFLSDDPEAALMHGPTFMAHPASCAAANASLDLFDEAPPGALVARIAAALEEGLAPYREIPGVTDVRVKGAIGVVQVESLKDVDGLKQRFVEEGVWIRPFGDIIYVTPAFVMPVQEVHALTAAIGRVLTEWATW